jgi:acyl-CoA thioesterase-2
VAINHFALNAGDDPARFVWEPSNFLLTPAGFVQGGAGLGAALTAMESLTGRPVIWATAQYLTFAAGIDPIDVEVNIEVAGRNTTQARCVLSREGTEILTAHAALGQRDFTHDGVWTTPPAVAPPDDCPRYDYIARRGGHLGEIVDFRLAIGRQLADIDEFGGKGDGNFALWIRFWEGRRVPSAADLTFIGDFMPMGFADAIGHVYAGNSLDNTLRIGDRVPTEWVLLSVQVQQVANGFGYGRAELWSQDGVLLGEVSQSAILRLRSSMKKKPT